jgi:hypothetical protein
LGAWLMVLSASLCAWTFLRRTSLVKLRVTSKAAVHDGSLFYWHIVARTEVFMSLQLIRLNFFENRASNVL